MRSRYVQSTNGSGCDRYLFVKSCNILFPPLKGVACYIPWGLDEVYPMLCTGYTSSRLANYWLETVIPGAFTGK